MSNNYSALALADAQNPDRIVKAIRELQIKTSFPSLTVSGDVTVGDDLTVTDLVTIGSGGVEGGLVPSKLVVEEGADGNFAPGNQPTVVISRLASGTLADENNNALAVISLQDDASEAGGGGIQCNIFGSPVGGDVAAFSGLAEGQSTANAFGMFFQAKATFAGGGAWGIQTDIQNNTGSPIPYTNGINQNKFVGIDLVFNAEASGAGQDSGVAAQFRGSGGSGWDVGLGFQGDGANNGIKTTLIDDDTDCVTLWNDTGTHTHGFNLTAATFTGAPYLAPLMTVATTSSTGTTGSIKWDANYVYVCTSSDTWKRAALSTW